MLIWSRNIPPSTAPAAVAAAPQPLHASAGQRGPDRRREPEKVEYRHAAQYGGDQHVPAIDTVERRECVGGRAELRLRAVDDGRGHEKNDEADATQAPQAIPNIAPPSDAVTLSDTLMCGSSQAEGDHSIG